jgi:hypothetical protein
MIDLPHDRPGIPNFLRRCPPFRVESDQLIAQVLITRDIAHRDVDSFLKKLMGLGIIV